ncbi:SRPBCC family protein [Streptomyces sp. HUAS TT20]|uniref:SRPBCC family protein n=1 Tax=Streptomyces sp. HUAS TT20 TaxID=3447509 RepID=UPI0021D80A55|nr:SRPBCC family protein [Streptomyces sp. HUAS 15-9]UXY25156.1 SRPBCC family protein [Streptomyces sp. HUAS 15-9]
MTAARGLRIAAWGVGVGGSLAAGYLGLVTGAVPVDVGVGRRTRALGPRSVDIAAPRETVFDVVARPYLGRTPRAMREKLHVLERGSDLVLAEHFTPVAGGRLRAVTVETVRFTRPERVGFRLVRGPVPQVTESFVLSETAAGTRLVYEGQLGTDLWRLGQWWGNLVASRWEAAVAASLASVKAEAERRSGGGRVNPRLVR